MKVYNLYVKDKTFLCISINMSVCLCGNINQDIIFALDRFPDFHEKVVTRYYYIGQGGSAANTAWWLAKMGVGARMIGSVGRDSLGDEAIMSLKDAGVDITGISRSCKRTGLATIMSCGQDKRMIKVKGANEDIGFNEKHYENATHIHLSSVNGKLARKIVNFAHERNVTISWDPSNAIVRELLSKIDYLFMNEDEHNRYHKEIIGRPPRNLIVTKNNGGCVINDEMEIEANSESALDTTGAGDAFVAGFIYGLTKGFEPKECGRWAVACTSQNVRAFGSRDGFSSLEEIREMAIDGA
jgi:ribokinase